MRGQVDQQIEIIGSDALGLSSLYTFDLSGAASLTAVGDIGPGYFGAGLVRVDLLTTPPPPPPPPIPEPGTLALLLAALVGIRTALPSSRSRRLA